MSAHLVWRLRNNDTAKHLCGLAADEIERLRSAVDRACNEIETMQYGRGDTVLRLRAAISPTDGAPVEPTKVRTLK